MATFNHISGAEPSTVTFKAATVSMTRNSSVMHQEIISLGDPDSSLAVAAVLAGNPASTAWGLVVRGAGPFSIQGNSTVVQGTSPWVVSGASTVAILSPTSTAAPAANDTGVVVRQVGYSTIVSVANAVATTGDSTVLQGTNPWLCAITGPISSAAPAAGDSGVVVRVVGYSTIVSVAALPANSSQVEVRALPANSSQVEVRNAVALSAANSSGLPSSGSSGLVVRQVWDDRLTAKSSNAFSSTSFTVASSVAGVKAYITAYSITSTVAAATKIAFYGGSTMTWPIQLQAVSSGVSGANLSGYPYLFHGDAAGPVTLQTPSSVAGVRVGVSYFLAP